MDKKKDVGALFDGIAGTYDRFNHLLSLNIDKSWRHKAVRSLDRAERLLDLATGTADLAIETIRQDKAASIVGMDISTQMMAIGRAKVEKAGYSDRITLVEGSALDIPCPDASFDAVTSAYGVRNFSDLDKGLSEMCRVLKSGGQLRILEFSYPGNKFIRAVYDFFFTNIMPVVGKLVSKDAGAYKYFRESVKGFIWGQEMAGRIAAAGFSDVSFKTMTFGISTLYIAKK